MSLLKKWQTVKIHVLNCLKPSERDDVLKILNEEIGYFLALIKLNSRNKFEDAAKCLIIFSDVYTYTIN